jgi:hypothetical protein
MNYASLMLGAVCIFAVAYYLVYGRRFYNGPIQEAGLKQLSETEEFTQRARDMTDAGLA